MRRSFQNGSGCLDTKGRTVAVLAAPPLNKGTVEERNALGFTALLPRSRGKISIRATDDMSDRLPDFQTRYARPAAECRDWKHDRIGGAVSLAGVVSEAEPTILIGTSTVAGSFTEAIIRGMAAHTQRPVIFPLSHPTASAEATRADLIAWTDGRALITIGSPFAPITYIWRSPRPQKRKEWPASNWVTSFSKCRTPCGNPSPVASRAS